MTIFPMLAVGFIMKVVMVLYIFCALALILIILVQKGKGGGLSGAFGGGMASGILGSKTGDFLTWVTIVLVGVFLTLAVVMAKKYRPDDDFDEGTTTPITTSSEFPPSSESSPPIGEIGTPPGGESTDANSPGTR
ncbi:MAG: preprotein translocase subunit SecG [Planctomycetota bacterium]|jgi:preprotein translocase subunit SecG